MNIIYVIILCDVSRETRLVFADDVDVRVYHATNVSLYPILQCHLRHGTSGTRADESYGNIVTFHADELYVAAIILQIGTNILDSSFYFINHVIGLLTNGGSKIHEQEMMVNTSIF